MTEELLEKFRNEYCRNCGTQRCTGEGEWLEGCRDYREFKEDKDEEI